MPPAGYFVENRGQVADGIRYFSMGNPSVAFRDDGAMFFWRGTSGRDPRNPSAPVEGREGARQSLAYLVTFEDANAVTPVGRSELPFHSNYFLGNDSAKWRANVANYGEVVYPGLYDGINLVYRPASNGVKYEFMVRPGSNPQDIVMSYEGIESLITEQKSMILQTQLGEIQDTIPRSYDTGGRDIDCTFVKRGHFSQGFKCDDWTGSETLTIDPLMYSTFLGGSEYDEAFAIDVDAEGSAYVTGYSYSANFPVTPGSYSTTHVYAEDVYIAKLVPDGSSLAYATFVGGGGMDIGMGIAVGPGNNAYVTGRTNSNNFPTTLGAFQSFNGDNDVFVVRLNETGANLVYSLYLGGPRWDVGWSIKVDLSGNAYVTGDANIDFPVTPGAYDTTYNDLNGTLDAFVAKLDPTGNSLVYSTFLGGSGNDRGYSIEIDPSGASFVAGQTYSADFPTTLNAFDTDLSGFSDEFLVEMAPTGSALLFSSYLGGSGDEMWGSVAFDSRNEAYITGETSSSDFPTTPGAFDRTSNWNDAFLTKVNLTTGKIVFSTLLGGTDTGDGDVGRSVAVDSSGSAYLTGIATSPDFPTTPGAFDTSYGGAIYDAFMSKFSPDGSALLYSTYLGTEGHDYGYSIALGLDGSVFIAGSTGSADFPTTLGAFDTFYNGGTYDGFVVRMNATSTLPDLEVTPSDVSFLPSPPIPVDSSVWIDATVRNIGTMASEATIVSFYEGVPPSPQIGADQPLSPIPPNGWADAQVIWNALQLGTHDICVVVDPGNAVSESDETNNQACVPVEVVGLPDYEVVSPSPSNPITVGLSLPVNLLLSIMNDGSGTPNISTTVAFFNDSTPSSPFSVSDIAPIATGNTIGPIAATWMSPATPGTYLVTVYVDQLNLITESNESNNIHTWTIDVVSGPSTILVIGVPKYTATSTYVRSSTALSLSVTDRSGLGIRETLYRIDSGGWVNYTAMGTFYLSGEGVHTVEWRSLDWAGNLEKVSSMDLTVDDTPPATTISPAAPFTLTAADSGCGVNVTMYRIDGGSWTVYTSGFTLTEGEHTIYYYSIDKLGNIEQEKSLVVKPPVEVAVNYKPIVALVFAIILLVAGVWSSKRRPWKGGKDRMAVAKAFAFISLSFVLAEAMTGIISLISGELRIPPYFDVGMAVDLVILLVGLGVAILTVLKAKQSKV